MHGTKVGEPLVFVLVWNAPLLSAMTPHEVGIWGEEWVCTHYRLAGYSLVSHRYKTPDFELDLLLVKQDLMVAVEVKTRRLTNFLPDSIPWDFRQRNRAWKGLRFLACKNKQINKFRLDFSAVYYSDNQRMMRVQLGGTDRIIHPNQAAFLSNPVSMMQNPR
jgi:Holliday junction resolvase-like predicted endonuclease